DHTSLYPLRPARLPSEGAETRPGAWLSSLAFESGFRVWLSSGGRYYTARMLGRVLVVAGSDSGGGAGIQADIKTITMLGAYAATAVTALTVQNTRGVLDVMPVPPAFVSAQMDAVLSDIGADCIKTGMLGSAEVIDAVVRSIERRGRNTPVVVDPVMVAKGGAALLASDAVSAVKLRLVPLAAVVTPNVPEAEALTGLRITNVEEMGHAADLLLAMGASAVLMKGGHLEGSQVVDILRTADGEQTVLQADRIDSRNTHGTGCTLASALAAGIADGLRLSDAAIRAHDYVQRAIMLAPGLGTGHGPLHHGHPLETPRREA
ncbi:MAG TPA: bifunctional hydroxymethylpyrimidine kinase/phosphomethylpyrimidine kinase, partial [Polyangiaceae bacterium]|nr:bifunctional hydroxymethylpyrimidine kinase/phosphomethylpyrimidine kinase [Polyangiaceae bacterium]